MMTEQTITWESLTADEQAALKYVNRSHVNYIGDCWESLYTKGLIEWRLKEGIDVLTEAGKRLLAGAPAADGRPDVITAKEFVSEGYAAKIERGECVVICHASDEVTGVNLYGGGWGILHFKWHDESGVGHFDSVTCKPTDTFGVEWLTQPEASQPVTDSGAGEVVGDRDGFLRTDLFRRVLDTLDLALAYLPGELAEFPDKVQSVVNDFRNYANVANKQIEERDFKLAAAENALATALGDYTVKSFEAYERAFKTELPNVPTPDYLIHCWEQGVKTLFKELATAQAENARLREALVFYGDEKTYELHDWPSTELEGAKFTSIIEHDNGDIARSALDGAKTEGG